MYLTVYVLRSKVVTRKRPKVKGGGAERTTLSPDSGSKTLPPAASQEAASGCEVPTAEAAPNSLSDIPQQTKLSDR